MRKNKKLLLASVAAMGALALGVGATSTFAWYSANSEASLAAVNKIGTINTAVNGHVEGIEVTIGYTATTKVGDGYTPDLTNDLGQTNYWVGSARAATGADGVGVFTFSANTTGVSDANKQLLRNHKYRAYVKGEGNVKVLSSEDATAVAKYTVTDPNDTEGLAVYISFSDAANPVVTVSLSENSGFAASIDIYYAVRTNNASGLEFMREGETLASSGQVIKTTTAADAASETIGYDSTTYHVQEKDGTWGDKANTGYIHTDADKISVSVASQL